MFLNRAVKAVIVLAVFSANVFSEPITIYTNAKLPNDERIWPIPEGRAVENCIRVRGRFTGSALVQRVEQGNWYAETYLVRYQVISPANQISAGEISFIVSVRTPTAESGIKVKTLPFPFQSGEKAFFLRKDPDVRSAEFYQIISYSR